MGQKKYSLPLFFIILALLIAGLFIASRFVAEPEPVPEDEGMPIAIVYSDPTDFAEAGTMAYNNPGLKADTPHLIYERPGQPALVRELIFDGLSVCSSETGSVACLAMSVAHPFEGQRVGVEGSFEGDKVLARKIRVIEDQENFIMNQPGRVYIGWPDAVRLLENCQVSSLIQSHSLDVDMELKDGREVRAVEPSIDEVFRVISRTREKCGDFPVATE